MKKTFKVLTLFAFLTFLFLPTGTAQAQGPNPDGGRVIFGNNFTLESGDTYSGDLVVFGGNVTIEEEAQLQGNLVIFGGTASSNGDVQGDVVIIGGQVNLDENAVVSGDVVTIGGQLERAEGAEVGGDVVNNIPPDIEIPSGQIPPVIPGDVPTPDIHIFYNPFVEVFWIFFWATVISAFAMLLTLFWQPQIERAGSSIVSQPLIAGSIGLLTFFVGAVLFLTIVPPIIVALAWLFGIVALGSEIGARFTKATNQTWSPVLTIGFGTFLLMLVSGAVGLIPCLGGFIQILLGLLGIGGAMITWFGSRLVQSPALTVYSPPPADPTAPAS